MGSLLGVPAGSMREFPDEHPWNRAPLGQGRPKFEISEEFNGPGRFGSWVGASNSRHTGGKYKFKRFGAG